MNTTTVSQERAKLDGDDVLELLAMYIRKVDRGADKLGQLGLDGPPQADLVVATLFGEELKAIASNDVGDVPSAAMFVANFMAHASVAAMSEPAEALEDIAGLLSILRERLQDFTHRNVSAQGTRHG
jgi:hypothetical protein